MDIKHGNPEGQPPFNETNESTPDIGGGLPVIGYWAQHTLSPEGAKIWETLLHKSACLSCSWGTGGQKGGFTNEEGEKLQRCMKSVEAITAEIQQAVHALITDYADLFADTLPVGTPPNKLPCRVCPLQPGAAPQYKQRYRLSPAEKEECQRQVRELLEQGLIEPSASPWGAPVL